MPQGALLHSSDLVDTFSERLSSYASVRSLINNTDRPAQRTPAFQRRQPVRSGYTPSSALRLSVPLKRPKNVRSRCPHYRKRFPVSSNALLDSIVTHKYSPQFRQRCCAAQSSQTEPAGNIDDSFLPQEPHLTRTVVSSPKLTNAIPQMPPVTSATVLSALEAPKRKKPAPKLSRPRRDIHLARVIVTILVRCCLTFALSGAPPE